MPIYLRGKVYWTRFNQDGKQYRRSLGTKDLVEAQRRYRSITGRTAPSPHSQPAPSHQRPEITMRHVLAQWVRFKRPRSKPQTIRLYEIVRRRFTSMWGDLAPAEITLHRIEETQATLLALGKAPRSINYEIGHALAAIRWAHERGLTDAIPPKPKRLKIGSTPTQKYLSATEIDLLLKTTQQQKFKRLEPVVMLALYAGLRNAEIIWLQWGDVDLEAGWIHVQPKNGWSPKTATSERSVPIPEKLAEYLATLPKNSEWVAEQNPGMRWSHQNLNAHTRKLFRAAKVDNGGPHTLHRLRGTFATQVLRSGGDLESLREILGHSSVSVTAGYLAASSESKRRAVGGVRFGNTEDNREVQTG